MNLGTRQSYVEVDFDTADVYSIGLISSQLLPFFQLETMRTCMEWSGVEWSTLLSMSAIYFCEAASTLVFGCETLRF